MAGVIFTSTIKLAVDGSWYIELQDITDPDDSRTEICKNLDEYESKIEQMGADYGGHIDEVRWLQDKEVTPHILDEIRLQMAEKRASIEEQLGEPITPVTQDTNI